MGRSANQTVLPLVTQTSRIKLDGRQQPAPQTLSFLKAFFRLKTTFQRSFQVQKAMPSSSLLHRFLNGKMPESEDDLVLPRNNPHKAPMTAVHPTLFSIEATANEESTSESDERVLLGIKNVKWTNEMQKPNYPRWM